MAKQRPLTTPRFWDLHLHGVAGIDFMHAREDEMVFACEQLGRQGTGAFAPTLLTAEPKLLSEACRRWGTFLDRHAASPRYLAPSAALPVGLHLEGPFLNPQMAGAHPPQCLASPSVAAARTLFEAARGKLAIMTLAPELPGALAVISYLKQAGVRVQLGHSLATSRQALAAVRAGASGITHLYNAMRIHHRDPGLLSPLANGLVTAELITDGEHLAPDFILWCASASRNVYAVSDGCSAVGAPKQRDLTLGSLNIERQGPIAVVRGSQILCGGATALAEHPERLAQAAALRQPRTLHQQLLALFYARQRQLFPSLARRSRGRNYFDPQTLKLVAVDETRR